jgi:hypothetical protein
VRMQWCVAMGGSNEQAGADRSGLIEEILYWPLKSRCEGNGFVVMLKRCSSAQVINEPNILGLIVFTSEGGAIFLNTNEAWIFTICSGCESLEESCMYLWEL